MLTTIFNLAPFLTQEAANGKFCQAKINFILVYKNWVLYGELLSA